MCQTPRENPRTPDSRDAVTLLRKGRWTLNLTIYVDGSKILMGDQEVRRRATAERTSVEYLKDSGNPSSGLGDDVSERMDVGRPGLILGLIFLTSLFVLFLVIYTFPELDE